MLDDDGRCPPRTKRKLPPYTHTKIHTLPFFCAATPYNYEPPLAQRPERKRLPGAEGPPEGISNNLSRSFPLATGQVRGLDDYFTGAHKLPFRQRGVQPRLWAEVL